MRLLLISALALLAAQPAHAQLAPPNAAGVTFGHVHLTDPSGVYIELTEGYNRY